MVLRIYCSYKCWGTHPEAALASEMEGRACQWWSRLGLEGSLASSKGRRGALWPGKNRWASMDRRCSQRCFPPRWSSVRILICSQHFGIRSLHGLQNNLLHCSYGRLAKEGATYDKRHGYTTLFLSGSELSAPEKSRSGVGIAPSKNPRWLASP